MITTLIIIALAMLLYFSWRLSKNITLNDFLSNSKSTNTPSIFMSLLASLIGGWMFLGLTKMSYEAGLVGLYIGIGYAIGFFLLYKYAGKIKNKMDKLDSHTLDDSVNKYYGYRVGIIVVIVNFIFFIAVLCAQFIVLKQILIPFNDIINVELIYWAFSFSVLFYTALTGYKGVLYTDKYQLIFVILLMVMLIISLNEQQLFYNLSDINVSYFSGESYGIGFILAVFILFPLSVLVRGDLWQRIASAKDVSTSKRAIAYVIPFLLISYIIMSYIGISIQTMNVDVPANINPIISLINHIIIENSGSSFNAVLLVILIGMGAALMSTIDSNLNVVVAAITKTRKFKNELFTARILSIVIGLIGLFLAIFVENLVDIIISAGAIILILFPVVFNLINSNKEKAGCNESKSAFYTLIFGYISLIVFIFILGVKIAFIPAFLLSLTVWKILKFKHKNYE